ncbi:hypothetical protein BJX64DRAFT_172250 [Aspergillus heterothallicus]
MSSNHGSGSTLRSSILASRAFYKVPPSAGALLSTSERWLFHTSVALGRRLLVVGVGLHIETGDVRCSLSLILIGLLAPPMCLLFSFPVLNFITKAGVSPHLEGNYMVTSAARFASISHPALFSIQVHMQT